MYIYVIITNGIDVISKNEDVLIDFIGRSKMISIVLAQRNMCKKEFMKKRKEGIAKAKTIGKYTGRKPIDVDYNVLAQVNKELKEGFISVEEAMKRVKIQSKSTFYRKVKELRG